MYINLVYIKTTDNSLEIKILKIVCSAIIVIKIIVPIERNENNDESKM